MGCDIHGHIEVQAYEGSDYWRSIVDVGSATGRSYDTFGSLFGVRNYSSFEPLFPGYGLPENPSWQVKEDYESWGADAHSASHLTFDELQDVDWDEESSGLDTRYSVLDENKEPTGTKFSLSPLGSSGWNDVADENREALDAGEAVPNEDGTAYIQRRRLTRADALSGRWEWLLFELWPLIHDEFHDSRMVVWFDN